MADPLSMPVIKSQGNIELGPPVTVGTGNFYLDEPATNIDLTGTLPKTENTGRIAEIRAEIEMLKAKHPAQSPRIVEIV